jgi:tRNA (guanine37-N1)-methyltransferase
MRFDVVTLFTAMFSAITENGITRRAHEQGLWSLVTWSPRDFTNDAHRTVDDRPFGGGPGMVMMAEPLAQAVAAAKADGGAARVLALSPSGVPLTDARVRALAGAGGSLALICGRYEGIDQRFLDECVDEVVSIGDFVCRGEIAAMALIDAIITFQARRMHRTKVVRQRPARRRITAAQLARAAGSRGAISDVTPTIAAATAPVAARDREATARLLVRRVRDISARDGGCAYRSNELRVVARGAAPPCAFQLPSSQAHNIEDSRTMMGLGLKMDIIGRQEELAVNREQVDSVPGDTVIVVGIVENNRAYGPEAWSSAGATADSVSSRRNKVSARCQTDASSFPTIFDRVKRRSDVRRVNSTCAISQANRRAFAELKHKSAADKAAADKAAADVAADPAE